MQAGNITTNMKVRLNSTFPYFSATKIMTSNFHVNESEKGKYDIIIGLYLLTSLGLNIILS